MCFWEEMTLGPHPTSPNVGGCHPRNSKISWYPDNDLISTKMPGSGEACLAWPNPDIYLISRFCQGWAAWHDQNLIKTWFHGFVTVERPCTLIFTWFQRNGRVSPEPTLIFPWFHANVTALPEQPLIFTWFQGKDRILPEQTLIFT